jgi:hyaluronoglucosaminidase
MTDTFRLGIIEGYFGKAWSWARRRYVVETLAPLGYHFFHYAPKIDPFLRRRWQEAYPQDEAYEIKSFAKFCAGLGVSFGVGLSPYEAFNDFNAAKRAALVARVEELAQLGCVELGIFFDDMHVTLPGLAEKQVEITHLARDTAPHLRLNITPSFYSDDPVLERIFGTCPPNYLTNLGDWLDPSIDVYWTGEEVCAREISPGHLAKVGTLLKRKPLLWDNYPVNDGPRMSQFLHVRASTGRAARNRDFLSGHGINPASQATLSCIPAITLARAYELGDDYCYGKEGYRASKQILGERLADMVQADLLSFQDLGLKNIEPRIPKLIERYEAINHPAALEIVSWLKGEFAITGEQVMTQ